MAKRLQDEKPVCFLLEASAAASGSPTYKVLVSWEVKGTCLFRRNIMFIYLKMLELKELIVLRKGRCRKFLAVNVWKFWEGRGQNNGNDFCEWVRNNLL